MEEVFEIVERKLKVGRLGFDGVMEMSEFLSKIILFGTLLGFDDEDERVDVAWKLLLSGSLPARWAELILYYKKRTVYGFDVNVVNISNELDSEIREVINSMRVSHSLRFGSNLSKKEPVVWSYLKFLGEIRNHFKGHGSSHELRVSEFVPVLRLLVKLSRELQINVRREEKRELALLSSGLVDRVWKCPFLQYKEDESGFVLYLPNGQVKAGFEFLDYLRGINEKILLDFDSLPRRPAYQFSTTRGLDSLAIERDTVHNLPSNIAYYVSRPQEELEIKEKLLGYRQAVIVEGGGGWGKTSLVLSVLRSLLESGDGDFDCIYWASARDYDLEDGDIRPTDVEVKNFVSLTKRIGEVFSSFELKPVKAKELLAGNLSDYKRGLLVMDNMETVERDREFFEEVMDVMHGSGSSHTWKLLVTTRSHQLGVDSSVQVKGMSPSQFDDLIEARLLELTGESEIGNTEREKLFAASAGHPLIGRVLTSRFVEDGVVPRNWVGDHEHLLNRLFTREYEGLSQGGQLAFQLISSYKWWMPSDLVDWIIEEVYEHSSNTKGYCDDLYRLSLIDANSMKFGDGRLSMVWVAPVARKFANSRTGNGVSLSKCKDLLKLNWDVCVNPDAEDVKSVLFNRVRSLDFERINFDDLIWQIICRDPGLALKVASLVAEEGETKMAKRLCDKVRSGSFSAEFQYEACMVLIEKCSRELDLVVRFEYCVGALDSAVDHSWDSVIRVCFYLNQILKTTIGRSSDAGHTREHLKNIALVFPRVIAGLKDNLTQMKSADVETIGWMSGNLANSMVRLDFVNQFLEVVPEHHEVRHKFDDWKLPC